ncbi:hypothetical protein G6F37_009249 [Rhizopus arrhizus]|nr:hypothetical protein G6F38_009703 [Rhizopus arrhizus]KAG1154660.1 hypothetical protein G6F37_009249 [Rhizopus arrhizus]
MERGEFTKFIAGFFIHHDLNISLTSLGPFDDDSPITLESVQESIQKIPPKKAPGVDHIRQEMLAPILDQIAPILLLLFRRCWKWSYTSENWRIARVIPTYKKGDSNDLSNYRPTNLASVPFKLLERCLLQYFIDNSPSLDLVQGGFRHSRALIFLLQNLFDEIHIEVLFNNANPFRFFPTTGVLQGFILSPFLYSIYINELPKLLRLQQLLQETSPTQMTPFINYLLCADDIVPTADKDHSHNLGYRWNPIPIRPGGYLHTFELLTNKSLATMNKLAILGLNPDGFSQLLATNFYKQIVRAQLEYGLAIIPLTLLVIIRRHSSVVSIAACMPLKKSLTMTNGY